MVAVKAHQAETFLKSPDSKLAAFLLYGSDEGLISERAQTLSAMLAARDDPQGEVLRLDDSDLENNPERLAIELSTIPMFGGRKIVRATTGRRINALTLKPLVQGGALEGMLIVEAGNLKPDDALRKAFEKAPNAAAIACYEDAARDLEDVIRAALSSLKMSINADARELLVSKLGADRAMSRSEIEKLALYASEKKEIEISDVEAIVGDASAQTIDRVVNATARGDRKCAAIEFERAITSGESAQGLILATERHFHRLHRIRAALDAGRPFDEAIRSLKPQVHFKQKDAFGIQCRMWSTDRLTRAIARISTVAKTARLAGSLEQAHAERLLLALASLARTTNSGMPQR